LLPYLYSLLFAAHRNGSPIISPLVYYFPDDDQCQTESFDFMLGDQLMVASVLEEGARERSIYLPKGCDWIDFFTGAYFTGGQTVTVPAPLERTPMLVRAGGILPLGKVMRFVGEQVDDLRQIFLFPNRRQGSGHFTLIEDDGISLGYQRGEFTELKINLQTNLDEIQLEIDYGRHGYPLPYEALEVIVPIGEERPLKVKAPQGLQVWTRVRNSLFDISSS